MIITASTAALSHSTDQSAAAVTAGFRSASFQLAFRTDEANRPPASAPLDVARLYPSLYTHADSPKALQTIRTGLATLRRVLAPAASAVSFTAADPNN